MVNEPSAIVNSATEEMTTTPTTKDAMEAATKPVADSTASLYVTDLAPETTQAHLIELFSQAGPLKSVRVCLDAHTRRSLCYGYVNFHNVADAQRALESLNFTPLNGKPIRAMWLQPDPSLRRSGVGNVFIKNLDKSVDDKALHDTFSVIGKVLSAKVVLRANADSNNAFVHFESPEAAQEAIDKVNGKILAGREVTLAHYTTVNNNVFIKNLPEDITDEKFMEMFAPFGKITSSLLQRDAKGTPVGFGFVNYEASESAVKAIGDMHDKEVSEGKKLYVGRAIKRQEREMEKLERQRALAQRKMDAFNRGVNLYVQNLEASIDEDRLRQEFSQFGTISSCHIMRDSETKASRGYGFVCFSSPDEATRAVTEMNGRMLENKPILVALAQRKEDRALHYAAAAAAAAAQFRHPMHPGPHPHAPHPLSAAGGPPMPGNLPAPPPYLNPAMFYAAAAAAGVRPPTPGTAAAAGQHFFNMRPGMPNAAMAGRPMPPFATAVGHPAGGFTARPNRPARPPRPGNAAGQNNGSHATGGPTRAGVRPGNHGNSHKFPALPRTEGHGGVNNNNNNNNNNVAAAAVVPPMMMPNLGGLSLHSDVNTGAVVSAPAAASLEEQKQMLGENLYHQIEQMEPQWAGKITGMLLEMNQSEIIHLIEHRGDLERKVAEASAVLRAHLNQQQQQHGGFEGANESSSMHHHYPHHQESAARQANGPQTAG